MIDQSVWEAVMLNIKQIYNVDQSNMIPLQGKPLILARISDIIPWEVIIMTYLDVFIDWNERLQDECIEYKNKLQYSAS